MNYRRESINQWLAFALALSVFGLSLSCLAICADHEEQSSWAPEEISLAAIEDEHEDECCSLGTFKYLPPERIQKTPESNVSRPLPSAVIIGFYHHQAQSMVAKAPRPDGSPPLQRNPALRI
jgi:hypothetical protein